MRCSCSSLEVEKKKMRIMIIIMMPIQIRSCCLAIKRIIGMAKMMRIKDFQKGECRCLERGRRDLRTLIQGDLSS